ncbi:MAG: alpha/beta fold hydrolase [Gammaproteobacteria bacterium]
MSTQVYAPRHPSHSTQHRIRDIDYHISEWGSQGDPLVVYLHGWSDAGSTLQAVVDALTMKLHVVAPDWRGFGRSGHSPSGYYFPDYLADLDALLDIYSPDEPVVLIGHSMGANVAGLYAGARPERVRVLVNVEGFGLAARDAQDAPGHYARWLKSVRQAARVATWPTFAALEQRIVRRAPTIDPAYAAFVAREWAQSDVDGVVTLRADRKHTLPNPVLYRREEAQACWSNIQADVQIVVGANSGLEEASNLWRDLVSNAEYAGTAHQRVIDNVGHMIHFEAPRALAGEIEAVADRLG